MVVLLNEFKVIGYKNKYIEIMAFSNNSQQEKIKNIHLQFHQKIVEFNQEGKRLCRKLFKTASDEIEEYTPKQEGIQCSWISTSIR